MAWRFVHKKPRGCGEQPAGPVGAGRRALRVIVPQRLALSKVEGPVLSKVEGPVPRKDCVLSEVAGWVLLHWPNS